MAFLQRFAPLGRREPAFDTALPKTPSMLSPNALIARGIGGGLAGILMGGAILALLAGVQGMKTTPTGESSFFSALVDIVQPSGIGAWIQLLGLVAFGTITGLVTAALSAVRRSGSHSNDDRKQK